MSVKRISSGVGNEMYEVPCIVCNSPVKVWAKRQGVNFKCKECKQKEKEFQKEKDAPLRRMLAERRLQIAIEYLEKRGILKEFSKPLELIGDSIYRTNWFQSSDEILVALELLRNGLNIRHQVNMGKWRVDFTVPILKVVLEVDGVLFHPKENKPKQRIRDSAIIANLGPEWEVIRITDKVIETNLKKLIPAIKKIQQERARVRRNFDYRLPKWYSDNHI